MRIKIYDHKSKGSKKHKRRSLVVSYNDKYLVSKVMMMMMLEGTSNYL